MQDIKHVLTDAKLRVSYGVNGTQPTDLYGYLGVYEFDPYDSNKEYLKYQHMIVRKSADHAGEEAGQIKGNLRSRTETGIEVLGDEIYLFCQGTKNSGETAPDVPSPYCA